MTEYKPEDILLLQNSVKLLEVDATGRYITRPENLKKIVLILRAAIVQLQMITVENVACPVGYSHKNCACLPPMDPGTPVSPWYED